MENPGSIFISYLHALTTYTYPALLLCTVPLEQFCCFKWYLAVNPLLECELQNDPLCCVLFFSSF